MGWLVKALSSSVVPVRRKLLVMAAWPVVLSPHGGDDVGAAEPVGFGEVGGGPLGGVVGVGVVEADDVEAGLAGLALGGDEFLRGDVVAVVGAVGAGVAGAEEFGDGEVCRSAGFAEQDAAALVGVGFFAVGAELVVERMWADKG